MGDNKSIHLTIVSYPMPPFTEPCFNEYPDNCWHPGTQIMLLLQLFSTFDVIVSFIKVESQAEGLQLLHDGVADLSGFAVSTGNLAAVKQAYDLKETAMVVEDRTLFAYVPRPKGELEHNQILLLKPYSSIVWACFVSAVVIVGIAKCAIKRCFKHLALPASHYIITASWGLMLTVLMCLYRNLIVISFATLLIKDYDQPFSSAADLAAKVANKECQIVVNRDSMLDHEQLFGYVSFKNITNCSKNTTNYCQNSSTRSIMNLSFEKAFGNNPPLILNGTIDAPLDYVINQPDYNLGKCFVIPDWMNRIKHLKIKYPNFYTIMDPDMTSHGFVHVMRPDISKKQILLINIAFTSSSSADLYDRIGEQYEIQKLINLKDKEEILEKQHLMRSRDDKFAKKLTIPQLLSCFMIILIGALVALIALVVEKVKHKSKLLTNQEDVTKKCSECDSLIQEVEEAKAKYEELLCQLKFKHCDC